MNGKALIVDLIHDFTTQACLEIIIQAPLYNDPPPPASASESETSTPGLWDYEVNVIIKMLPSVPSLREVPVFTFT